VILLTNERTSKQTKWKHNLLGGGKYHNKICEIRRPTCTQQTWIQIIWVIGGGKKSIRPKLLQCAGKSWYLGRHLWALEQGSYRR